MTITYNESNLQKFKKSLDRLLKMFEGNDNLTSLNFDPKVVSEEKKYKVINQQYGFMSKKNKNNNVTILSTFNEEKTWISPYREYTEIFVFYWDMKKVDFINKVGRKLLSNEIKNYKKNIEEKRLKKNKLKEIKNKRKQKLKNKYNY